MYTETDYKRERALVDTANAYWKANASYSRGGFSSMSAELCAHPDYAAVDNDMRARVERYELLRDLPDKFTAYTNSDQTCVTLWNGSPLGSLQIFNSWRSNFGDARYSGRVKIGGATYSVLSFGGGMYCRLRKIKGK
jgi:hypothetical protein